MRFLHQLKTVLQFCSDTTCLPQLFGSRSELCVCGAPFPEARVILSLARVD